MAASKSLFSGVTLLLLVVVGLAAVQTQVQAQAHDGDCPVQISNLNVCAPFVVPGARNTIPSQDCCSALQSIDHDCICSTLRISAQIPSQCNLPPLSCPAN